MLILGRKVKELENIYKLVAEKNNTTPRLVKKEIRSMIKSIWLNTQEGSTQKRNQSGVVSKGMIPTNEELILHILTRLISEQ
ncbi:MAG: sporulation initiation factor Spo0A C-terminal domain-containing protein [Clostridiales bacterium]|nr:sporulation initiation factor Spo0A C-terminal domain-containing protein [Clostridiales bacterium]